MVRDLLEGFVREGWLAQLDYASLEKVNGSYVSDDLRERADDLVWRVRWGERWIYVYLLLEFQSTVERYIAVRIHTYVGLLAPLRNLVAALFRLENRRTRAEKPAGRPARGTGHCAPPSARLSGLSAMQLLHGRLGKLPRILIKRHAPHVTAAPIFDDEMSLVIHAVLAEESGSKCSRPTSGVAAMEFMCRMMSEAISSNCAEQLLPISAGGGAKKSRQRPAGTGIVRDPQILDTSAAVLRRSD